MPLIGVISQLLLTDPPGRTQYEIAVQAIRMANDDGSNETRVTPQDVTTQVQAANQILAPTRIRLRFNPHDFETRRHTALNLFNPTKNSHVDNQVEIEAALDLGDEFRGRLVVIYRRSHDVEGGEAGPGSGFSTDQYYKSRRNNYIVMPDASASHLPMLAHECGHYLGLSHTEMADQRNVMSYGAHLSNVEGGGPSRVTITPSQIERMRQVLEERRLQGLLSPVITPAEPGWDIQPETVLNPNKETVATCLGMLLLQ